MLSLDIRTLSFIAMLSSLLLALGLQIVNRVVVKNSSLRLWAIGATATGAGFTLMAMRGVVPDLFSIVIANTLLLSGSAWQYLGNRSFQDRGREFPWYWILVAITALAFCWFTYLAPSLSARIVVISAAIAAVRFASGVVLLSRTDTRDALVRWFVAGAHLLTAIFLGARAVVSVFIGPEHQDFMAIASPIHTFALVIEVALAVVLSVGLPLLVLGRTHQRLIASEDRYRTLIEWSPEPVAVHGGGRVLYANPAAREMMGAKSEHELVGKPLLNWVHPDYHQIVLERLKRQAESGVNLPMIEEKFVRLDGTPIDVEVQSIQIFYDGKIASQVAMRDVTQRKQIEADLRDSEERYRTAFLTSPDAININRLSDGLYLDANEGFTRQVGWRRDEVIGKTSREINIWNDMSDRQRLVDALTRDGYCKNLEANFVTRDGSIVTALMSAHVMTLKGELCILSVTRDITERKQAQEQILKLSLAVEQSPESIVITNMAAEIEYVNEAFLKNTGYSREELLGKNSRILHSGKTPRETFASLWRAMTRGETWNGEFHNRRKDGTEYIEHAVITPIRQPSGEITHFVAVKEDITARKAAEEEINSLAFYDTLTGLPNRRLLHDRLKQALAASTRNRRFGALLFIDLDNFKTLNDTLGHDIGDLLLQQVAQRLSTCVREGDTVARLGGDEFVVMLEDLSENSRESATQAETVGEKILTTLNKPYQLASYPHHSTPSIGVTLFSDQQGTIDDLLKRADLAMYQAKAAGRNTLRFFDPEMQAVVATRAALEADLRDGMLKDQFQLYYQAQVVGEGRMTGVEALLRWQQPERGMVSPADFIPLAEDTGLILPLGLWVLQTACEQLAKWAERPAMAHLTIAVNVSARQFHSKDFVDQVLAVLAHTGANPHRLKLELTESLLVADVEDVIAKMTRLKHEGVGFSLDDFGTGFSSLSYLKRLPLDQLKIDQGFVRDILTSPNDAAIARTVVALAESLGLAVIAEGVELAAQRDSLASHGCHAYQGYLFSRPLPIGQFEAYALRA